MFFSTPLPITLPHPWVIPRCPALREVPALTRLNSFFFPPFSLLFLQMSPSLQFPSVGVAPPLGGAYFPAWTRSFLSSPRVLSWTFSKAWACTPVTRKAFPLQTSLRGFPFPLPFPLAIFFRPRLLMYLPTHGILPFYYNRRISFRRIFYPHFFFAFFFFPPHMFP